MLESNVFKESWQLAAQHHTNIRCFTIFLFMGTIFQESQKQYWALCTNFNCNNSLEGKSAMNPTQFLDIGPSRREKNGLILASRRFQRSANSKEEEKFRVETHWFGTAAWFMKNVFDLPAALRVARCFTSSMVHFNHLKFMLDILRIFDAWSIYFTSRRIQIMPEIGTIWKPSLNSVWGLLLDPQNHWNFYAK